MCAGTGHGYDEDSSLAHINQPHGGSYEHQKKMGQDTGKQVSTMHAYHRTFKKHLRID